MALPWADEPPHVERARDRDAKERRLADDDYDTRLATRKPTFALNQRDELLLTAVTPCGMPYHDCPRCGRRAKPLGSIHACFICKIGWDFDEDES